ncbi:hypothetical protein BS50DRAFT_580407 [Corynespora cassiicola Philippines]|uniref:Uncharacterized protein n=1 Tax=Corynespora cassiicola Philippines TaxID=1448308 RepID=A0A2T2N0R3_CORCC|nr:hypothetical protein BS50DRAFT_580407 [Corynespora cassiicola Philippines]
MKLMMIGQEAWEDSLFEVGMNSDFTLLRELTSLPTCRETLRAENFDRYLDFANLQL